jgi:Uma2 family endonuclease
MASSIAHDSPQLASAVAELWPPQGQWKETDYFNLPETTRLVELAKGEVTIMPPPGIEYQQAAARLYTAISSFVETSGLGIVLFAPVAVRLWPGLIREPDILFYAAANVGRLGKNVSGPPDLAIEIISPGSRKTDRHDKFYEYAQAGISEYWLVDPDSATLEVFVLEDGAYALLVKAATSMQTAYSQLLAGFAIACSAIFPPE